MPRKSGDGSATYRESAYDHLKGSCSGQTAPSMAGGPGRRQRQTDEAIGCDHSSQRCRKRRHATNQAGVVSKEDDNVQTKAKSSHHRSSISGTVSHTPSTHCLDGTQHVLERHPLKSRDVNGPNALRGQSSSSRVSVPHDSTTEKTVETKGSDKQSNGVGQETISRGDMSRNKGMPKQTEMDKSPMFSARKLGGRYREMGHQHHSNLAASPETQSREKAKQSSSAIKPTRSSTQYCNSSRKAYAWQTPCSRKEKEEESDSSYGKDLAALLSDKVQHIRPDKLTERDRSKSATRDIPSTRNEAKHELKRAMKGFKKDIDACDAEKTSVAGDVNAKGIESEAEGNPEGSTNGGPKEKPFGSKGNIHTLGCFQNESSKEVTSIHGKVHGFKP